jgi:hypothetical protein
MGLTLKQALKRYGKVVGARAPDDRLEERAGLAARIAQCAQGGRVAIVYGGMDCDCSRWDDRVVLVPATTVAVERWIDSYHERAEGPQWTRVTTPAEARGLKASSRDLALEAFEDGHQHVVYL